MPIKQAAFNIKGMVRDLATSKFNPDYAFENKNMRLITTDENSAAVLTTEKSNKKIIPDPSQGAIIGMPIGQAQLDNELILFTTTSSDYKYVSQYTISEDYLNYIRLYNISENVTSGNGESIISTIIEDEETEGEENNSSSVVEQSENDSDNESLYTINSFETTSYSGYQIIRNYEEEVATSEEARKRQKVKIGIFDNLETLKYVINPPEYGGYLIILINNSTNTLTIYYCNNTFNITSVTDAIIEESISDLVEFTVTYHNINNESNDDPDHIYKIDSFAGDIRVRKLYSGNLNFFTSTPLECLTVYENEDIKKVYWTDGVNPLRFINVSKTYDDNIPEDSFDFLREVKSSSVETVTITKNMAVNGVFAPGTIQYLFSYYNLYGQQSKIFYASPLYYISYNDRGAAENDTISVSFHINIEDLDQSYDYLRIYSLQRTSINSTPIARKVVDIKIEGSTATYTDLGDRGSSIDPTSLLYIGGENISVGTLTQKNNTLFLGDIEVKNDGVINSELKENIQDIFNPDNGNSTLVTTGIKQLPTNFCKKGDYYYYDNQLIHNIDEITTFKLGEVYRTGIQLQDIYGKWSNPIFLRDIEITPIGNDRPYEDIESDNKTYQNLFKITASNFANLKSLLQDKFIKIRPVIVYPTLSDRNVICQGVLCPTVYNAEDRYNKFPDVQSSWFFRPEGTASISSYESPSPWGRSKYGKYLEFRHNYPIPGNDCINSEIQCIIKPPQPYLGTTHDGYTEKTNAEDWVNENKECFYVDQSIVTFHSPDIEFDKNIRNLNLDGVDLRIVGWVPITSNITDIKIKTSTPPLNFANGLDARYVETATGFYKKQVSHSFRLGADESPGADFNYSYYSIASGVYWLDELYGTSDKNDKKLNVGFVTYPWHRTGSLNNTSGTIKDDEVISAELERKVMSQLRYSQNNIYISDTTKYWERNKGNKGIHAAIFDSNEDEIIKIKEPDNSNIGDIIYKGNVDSVITFHTRSKKANIDGNTDVQKYTDNVSAFYPIITASRDSSLTENTDNSDTSEAQNFKYLGTPGCPIKYFSAYYGRLKEYDDSNNKLKYYATKGVHSCSNNAVSMRYKSTPHAVVALNYDDDRRQIILPAFKSGTNKLTGNTNNMDFTYKLFWDKNANNNNKSITGITQERLNQAVYPNSIDIDTKDKYKYDETGILWLAELTQTVSAGTRFGGESDEAIAHNDWLPAGPEILINDIDNSTTLNWVRGDTYYQRYDCLKTYPYTQEDENSIVEILSFMCETRVNIDGRYDKNRGQNSNLYVTPNNFNLLNSVYSQKDNFFTYKADDENKVNVKHFPNTITWTKTKTLGEEIDSWTEVTLASTLDLDGGYGKITALRKFNDNLIAFQDKGISQILYDENVQIQTSAGVPIEIANSGKVQGARTLSNLIGCTNKRSICNTPNGIYFINNLSKDIYLFSGEFKNISETYGMHSWVQANLSKKQEGQFENGCITYYDPINKEVLFITQTDCLAFSEAIGAFTSFYDYDQTLGFGKIDDKVIAIHQDRSTPNDYNYYPYIQHGDNTYNNLFGKIKPYWTTIIANPNPLKDKIFNNIEFQADVFDATNKFITSETFDSLSTWNEYQEGFISLQSVANKPSSLKKKFRMWRANIPRWNINKNGIQPNYRDRMRNPWLFIKLSKEEPTNNKLVLHNILVNYFE